MIDKRIIRFGNQFDQFCDTVSRIVTEMETNASKAENCLKDEVSKNNIQKIYEILMRLKDIVDRGEGRKWVRETIFNAQKEQAGADIPGEGKERILWLIE